MADMSRSGSLAAKPANAPTRMLSLARPTCALARPLWPAQCTAQLSSARLGSAQLAGRLSPILRAPLAAAFWLRARQAKRAAQRSPARKPPPPPLAGRPARQATSARRAPGWLPESAPAFASRPAAAARARLQSAAMANGTESQDGRPVCSRPLRANPPRCSGRWPGGCSLARQTQARPPANGMRPQRERARSRQWEQVRRLMCKPLSLQTCTRTRIGARTSQPASQPAASRLCLIWPSGERRPIPYKVHTQARAARRQPGCVCRPAARLPPPAPSRGARSHWPAGRQPRSCRRLAPWCELRFGPGLCSRKLADFSQN